MLAFLALGSLWCACAEGVAIDSAQRRDALFGTSGAPGDPVSLPAGAAADAPPPADATPDAGPALDGREACGMGERVACVCEETGTAGTRRCVFDEASPTGGYLDICRGCPPPACDDMVLNGAEVDVDCGGSECGPCRVGQACAAATDCDSGECTGGVCAMPVEQTPAPDTSTPTTPEPEPEPEPEPGCLGNRLQCLGLFECCKDDGSCGTQVLLLCL